MKGSEALLAAITVASQHQARAAAMRDSALTLADQAHWEAAAVLAEQFVINLWVDLLLIDEGLLAADTYATRGWVAVEPSRS